MVSKVPSSKPSGPGAKTAKAVSKSPKPPMAKAPSPKPKAAKPPPKAPAAKAKAPRGPRTPVKAAPDDHRRQRADPGDFKYVELDALTKPAFLITLSQVGIVTKTCELLKMSPGMAYLERNSDPAFRKAWDQAVQDAFPVFEDEVRRRAFQGYDRPVFQQGMLVGTVREYSDKLAELMVRSGKPEVYNPKTTTSIEHAGTIGVLYANMSDEELNKRCNAAIAFFATGKNPITVGDDPEDPKDLLHPKDSGEDDGSVDAGEANQKA